MLETFRKTTHLPYTKKLPYAFCHGTGKDPFGQLYPVSTCQDCHGRIENYILTPYKTRTYCPGTGLACSTQNTCTFCKGRGFISLGNKELDGIPCQICTGNGMGAETNLPWIPCSGLGRR
jgi:DnaJ-class molecular chaperone